jgi:hypothetical protein
LSENHGIFSFMETISVRSANAAKSPRRASGKPSVSIDAAIRARVDMANRESVFSPVDFTGLGSRAAVDKALSRLTASGELRRFARGLYDRPQTSSALPSAEQIARALAGKSGVRLQKRNGRGSVVIYRYRLDRKHQGINQLIADISGIGVTAISAVPVAEKLGVIASK